VTTGYKHLLTVSVVLLAALLVACSGGSEESVGLDLSGIQPLNDGFHYEVWVTINGKYQSLGKFNVSANGLLATPEGRTIKNGEFTINPKNDFGIDDVTAVMVSIESSGDMDGVPSDTRFLAGAILDGVASLVVGNAEAIGNTFENANGFYILAAYQREKRYLVQTGSRPA